VIVLCSFISGATKDLIFLSFSKSTIPEVTTLPLYSWVLTYLTYPLTETFDAGTEIMISPGKITVEGRDCNIAVAVTAETVIA